MRKARSLSDSTVTTSAESNEVFTINESEEEEGRK